MKIWEVIRCIGFGMFNLYLVVFLIVHGIELMEITSFLGKLILFFGGFCYLHYILMGDN